MFFCSSNLGAEIMGRSKEAVRLVMETKSVCLPAGEKGRSINCPGAPGQKNKFLVEPLIMSYLVNAQE